jgi:sRNA-binding regulator protein Hfq
MNLYFIITQQFHYSLVDKVRAVEIFMFNEITLRIYITWYIIYIIIIYI